MSHTVKLVERIINHVLRTIVELGNIHVVFRRGRSTMDPVFVLQCLQETYREKNQMCTWYPQTDLRRRYTIRFARTKPADCPVHGSIVTCDMSLECPGRVIVFPINAPGMGCFKLFNLVGYT